MVSQLFISWEDYVFNRKESLDAKANEPIFVYVIMQIINKKYVTGSRPTMNKELWGTKLH
jgi:hypothetical protein